MNWQVFYTEWENEIAHECIRLASPTHQALRFRLSCRPGRVLDSLASVLDTRSRPSFAADALTQSRDRPICPEAGLSIPRPACPSRGGSFHPEAGLQGHLAHKKQPPPPGPPYGHRHSPTVGSQGGAVSYERDTPVHQTDCGRSGRKARRSRP